MLCLVLESRVLMLDTEEVDSTLRSEFDLFRLAVLDAELAYFPLPVLLCLLTPELDVCERDGTVFIPLRELNETVL